MKKGAPPYSSISGLELWLALRERIFRFSRFGDFCAHFECLACFWKPPCSRNGQDGLLWEGGLTLLGSCCCLFGTWDVGRFLKQSIFYHLSSRWTSFPMLTRASLGEKYGIKPDVKNKKLSPQQSKFSSVDLRWDRSVTVPWQKMIRLILGSSYFWAPK